MNKPDSTTARRRSFAALAVTVAATALTFVCAPVHAAAATALDGTLVLARGSCAGGAVSGSYLRMILPSGTTSGPYMSNNDSACGDQTYTLLAGGTDGGLISGSYQPTPSPAFDASGAALAGRITAPVSFYGTAFATSSNAVDPQTRTRTTLPRVYVNGARLTADLRAFSVTWNNQYFNQGAPKPDGSLPGLTRAASGTYDAATGAFTLDWTSQVVGGPFDKFTGQWHLAGRFVAARSAPNAAPNVAADPAADSAATAAAPAAGAPSATASGPAAAAGSVGVLGSRGSREPVRSAAPSHAATANAAAGRSSESAGTQQLAASTVVVTRERWRVSWWVVALLAGLAVAGAAALFALNRVVASQESASSASQEAAS